MAVWLTFIQGEVEEEEEEEEEEVKPASFKSLHQIGGKADGGLPEIKPPEIKTDALSPPLSAAICLTGL